MNPLRSIGLRMVHHVPGDQPAKARAQLVSHPRDQKELGIRQGLHDFLAL